MGIIPVKYDFPKALRKVFSVFVTATLLPIGGFVGTGDVSAATETNELPFVSGSMYSNDNFSFDAAQTITQKDFEGNLMLAYQYFWGKYYFLRNNNESGNWKSCSNTADLEIYGSDKNPVTDAYTTKVRLSYSGKTGLSCSSGISGVNNAEGSDNTFSILGYYNGKLYIYTSSSTAVGTGRYTQVYTVNESTGELTRTWDYWGKQCWTSSYYRQSGNYIWLNCNDTDTYSTTFHMYRFDFTNSTLQTGSYITRPYSNNPDYVLRQWYSQPSAMMPVEYDLGGGYAISSARNVWNGFNTGYQATFGHNTWRLNKLNQGSGVYENQGNAIGYPDSNVSHTTVAGAFANGGYFYWGETSNWTVNGDWSVTFPPASFVYKKRSYSTKTYSSTPDIRSNSVTSKEILATYDASSRFSELRGIVFSGSVSAASNTKVYAYSESTKDYVLLPAMTFASAESKSFTVSNPFEFANSIDKKVKLKIVSDSAATVTSMKVFGVYGDTVTLDPESSVSGDYTFSNIDPVGIRKITFSHGTSAYQTKNVGTSSFDAVPSGILSSGFENYVSAAKTLVLRTTGSPRMTVVYNDRPSFCTAANVVSNGYSMASCNYNVGGTVQTCSWANCSDYSAHYYPVSGTDVCSAAQDGYYLPTRADLQAALSSLTFASVKNLGFGANGYVNASSALTEANSAGYYMTRDGYFLKTDFGSSTYSFVSSVPSGSQYSVRCFSNTAPSVDGGISVSETVNASNSGSFSVTLSGVTEYDPGQTVSYLYAWNSDAFATVTSDSSPVIAANKNIVLDASSIPEWANVLNVKLYDGRTYSATVSAPVSKDSVAPQVVVSENPTGTAPYKDVTGRTVVGASETMEKSVSPMVGDYCGVARVFSPYANGTETIRFESVGSVCFRATDAAGNVTYSNYDVLGVDRPPSVDSLLVNGSPNPSKITDLYPTFSWNFSDADSGDYQSSYRIVVNSSGAAIPSWDSGKVASSDSTVGYVWNNLSLDGADYEWTVTVWDAQDVAATSTGTFSMLGIPNAPAFSVDSYGNADVAYSWDDASSGNSQEDSVEIVDGSGNVVATLPADSVAHAETGLSPNTEYKRSACPKNAAGRSCSATARFVTYSNSPDGFTASVSKEQDGTNVALVEWSAPDASRVELYDGAALIYSGTASSFSYSGLASDRHYALEIRAFNSDGIQTPVSSALSFRTLPGSPDVSASRPVWTWFNFGGVGISNSASGVDSYYWKASKSASYSPDENDARWSDLSSPISFSPDSDGPWYVHLTPVGSSWATGQSASFGVWNYDTVAPAAISVSKFYRTALDAVSLSGTCSYESWATVVVSDNLVPIDTFAVTNPCRISWSKSGMAPGDHSLTVSVVDRAGNASAPATLSFRSHAAGSIDTPKAWETVGTSFSVTGFGKPNSPVSIFDGSSAEIASGTTDDNGFYAVQTYAQPIGPIQLDVAVDGIRANSPVNVTVASDSVRTPKFTNIPESGQLTTKVPSISVSGEPGSRVRLFSKDADGNLTDIGGVRLDSSGNGTVASEAEFSLGENVIFAIDEVYGLSSSIKYVVFVDPWGYVYDSVTKRPIAGAKVTLLDSSWAVVPLPPLSGVAQPNPMFTDVTGYYGSYELPGTYRIVVEKDGYKFPSSRIASGSKNLDGTDNAGSHGQFFTVSTQILHIDVPMDPVTPSVSPAPAAGGGGSAWITKDYCPEGDYSSSYYDEQCGKKPATSTGTALTGASLTGTVVDRILELPCYAVDDVHYLDLTGTPWMSSALEKMIRCWIVKNGIVLAKSDALYRYDVMRMVALVKGLDTKAYKIPKSAKPFTDFPKTRSDAKLVYMVRENGYVPASKTAKPYALADSQFVIYVLKKTFDYDARADLGKKRYVTMREYLAALYKASEYAKSRQIAK